MHTTPPTLLERLCHRCDEHDWGWFVELCTPLLFRWTRRAGETEQDAADLVQEVFVVLLQTLPHFQYDRASSFRGWLRTLLLNKLRDRKRREVRHVGVLRNLRADAEAPDVAEVFSEAEYLAELARQALRLMRNQFETTTWKACGETVVQSRPAHEVARELGITENAVYIARCRVLRWLR